MLRWLPLGVVLAACAGRAPEGMVRVPSGSFVMGNDAGPSDQRPAHQVTITGFWMDRTEVTNAQFARFIAATGYRTLAERNGDGLVFVPPQQQPASLVDFTRWWVIVKGADWRHPVGPDSSIVGREDHPVVQVGWDDAVAFARWAGKRLPTEAQWEYAARGGMHGTSLVCGAPLESGGVWRANIFQGMFPTANTAGDGHVGTAPVASFPANAYGLHDMAGNVWEWCADRYRADAYMATKDHDLQGPATSDDPDEPGLEKRVIRGGSYLCSDVYCRGYEPGARMKSALDTTLCHTGFRCVR